jgi:hypothetical protein
MKTIHKYPITHNDRFSIAMPENAKILTAQKQGSYICIWAETDTNDLVGTREFILVGTGHPILVPERARKFIATIQDNQFVWHLFELINFW